MRLCIIEEADPCRCALAVFHGIQPRHHVASIREEKKGGRNPVGKCARIVCKGVKQHSLEPCTSFFRLQLSARLGNFPVLHELHLEDANHALLRPRACATVTFFGTMSLRKSSAGVPATH